MASHESFLGERTMVDLDPSECLTLLASKSMGRIVFLDGGHPLALPVSHSVHEGSVVFKTIADGTLESALAADDRASFLVDDHDPERFVGWSVLVRGHAELVSEPAAVEALDRLELYSWFPDLSRRRWVREAGAWQPAHEHRWVRVRASSMTGRRTKPG